MTDRWSSEARRLANQALGDVGDLVSALPAWMQAALLGDRREIHLDVEDQAIVARLAERWAARPSQSASTDGEPDIARLRAITRRRPVILCVPMALILESDVDIPSEAARKVEPALRYGLAKWTPFGWDEVYAVARVVTVSGDKARLKLRLALRSAVDPLIQKAAAEGFAVDGLSLGDETGKIVRVQDGKYRRLRNAARIDLALLASALVLAAAFVLLTLDRAETERSSLQAEIQAAIAQHRAAEALQRQVSELQHLRDQLVQAHRSYPSIGTILGELASALPADGQINEVSWTGLNGRLVVDQPLTSSSTLNLPSDGELSVTRVVMDRTSRPGRLLSNWELSVRPEAKP